MLDVQRREGQGNHLHLALTPEPPAKSAGGSVLGSGGRYSIRVYATRTPLKCGRLAAYVRRGPPMRLARAAESGIATTAQTLQDHA